MLEASKGEAEASGVGYFVFENIYDVTYSCATRRTMKIHFLLSLRLSLEGEDKGEGVTINRAYFLGNLSCRISPPANDENTLPSPRLSLEGEDKGEGVTVNRAYFPGNMVKPFGG
jgi:hypothetical protein